MRITDHGTAQYPCSLELTGNVLHLVWPYSRAGKWEVTYKRSADGGDTWGPERRLTPGVDLFRMGTAVSGSTHHVVWGSRRLVTPTPAGTHTWGEIYSRGRPLHPCVHPASAATALTISSGSTGFERCIW